MEKQTEEDEEKIGKSFYGITCDFDGHDLTYLSPSEEEYDSIKHSSI